MDFVFWGIVLIPVVISLFCKFALRWEISWLEWGAQVVIGLACLSLIWAGGRYSATADTEIVNGAVTAKDVWRFSCPINTGNPCRNGYSCNCVQVPYECGSSDSKGNYQSRTCYRTECDTCYKYDWEQNWYVHNNMPVSNKLEIDRVDEQGAREPPRYSRVNIGDPTSAQHSYQNWVKASVGTLYSEDKGKDDIYAQIIGTYPTKVYDYYMVDRVLTPNFKLRNEAAWNRELAKAVSTLGPQKQMNLVVVIAENVPRDYAYGLRRSWEGFKKNDAVIIIGTRGGAIQWAEVMSWSKNELFNVELRNKISVDMRGQDINAVDPALFFSMVHDVGMRNFERRPMAEFEYLKGSIPPPLWLMIACAIAAVLLGLGTSYIFNRVDLDDALLSRFRGNSRFNRFR